MTQEYKTGELYRGGSDIPEPGGGFNYAIELIKYIKLNSRPPGARNGNGMDEFMLRQSILGQRFYTDDFLDMI